jgi:hypothetical protein
MTLHRPSHTLVHMGLSILMTSVSADPLHAQDPVQKPVSRPAAADRLPMPQSVTVRQTGGTITVEWRGVEGAKSYVLGRAVGNEGFRRLLDVSTGPDTIYVDRQVTPGVRHVYTITPISQSDVSGVRATSEAIVPSATSSPRAPITVRADLVAPNAISVTWRGSALIPARYEVTHWLDGRLIGNLGRVDGASLLRRDLPPGAHHFEVKAIHADGVAMNAVRSNVVQIDAAAPGTSEPPTTPTSPVTTATASDASAAVLVTMAAPVTLRVGGSTSLPVAVQWTSLQSGIASVSGDGTVTGRAAGIAQIVALGTSGDGTVRVTVVRVVVQP